MLKVHYKLENQEQDGKANLSYISPGIKWSPNYLVKVNEEAKTLTVGGRATIVSSIHYIASTITCVRTERTKQMEQ